MEKKFFTKVTVLLLPPLFNQINFQNNGIIFLGLNDIAKSKELFSNLKLEEDKKDLCSFAKKVNEDDFSDKVIDLIINESEKRQKSDFNIVLVNYPINISQFENLENKLEDFGIEISKMIVSNPLSFDVLIKTKSNYFLCPLCFKAHDRQSNLIDSEYSCPLNDEKFTISQINKFTDFFIEYYLQNSLKVIQKFAESDKEEKNKKRKMFPLTIESDENIEETIKKNLLNIIENN
ncbi:MAG: Adenylate kinase [Mycoplasmataceae bacterium]|nr:MAG: Adenylate kinase [Mycoplasmataceae bacterium]